MLKRIRSERIQNLLQSEIRAMTRACNEVGGVNLGQGICDVPTPDLIKEAAYEAIRENQSIYTRHDGDAVLREAMARKFARYNGIPLNPDTEVVVTTGASGALAATLMALCDPGDEIILFEPFYGYHLNTALVAGMVPKIVPLHPPTFHLDLQRLRDTITPKTRAILVNTPVNPSGKVFSRDELVAIGAIATEFDLLVITDEVYEYMVYGDRQHVSMASLPGMRERTVTLGSYSKTFNITGWRIGYAVADASLAGPIGLLNDLYYVCAPAPLQRAVAVGIDRFQDDYYADLLQSYTDKRKQFCDTLVAIGLTPIVPDGAYYVLADITSLGCDDAKAAAMKLLYEAKVASVPGTAFFTGAEGQRLVRFCYAKQQPDLDRACEYLLSWGSKR
jgi:aminotransferase